MRNAFRMVWCGWIESATPSCRARSCAGFGGGVGSRGMLASQHAWGRSAPRASPPACWHPSPCKRCARRCPAPAPPTMDSNSVEWMTNRGNMKTRVVNQLSMNTACGGGAGGCGVRVAGQGGLVGVGRGWLERGRGGVRQQKGAEATTASSPEAARQGRVPPPRPPLTHKDGCGGRLVLGVPRHLRAGVG